MTPPAPLSIQDVLQATGGTLLAGNGGGVLAGVSTDTRSIRAGELFVALRGDRFDGHGFLGNAVRAGASGVVVDRDLSPETLREIGTVAAVRVEDTLVALGQIARCWRRRFTLPVLAITGSAGKTTTKEMAAAILAKTKRVLKTEGNFNNLVGLPLTLLGMKEEHEAAVLELGTNRPGEIAALTRIAEPGVGVITNAGPAHLEGLRSLDAVAEEKADLFRFLPMHGVAVVNRDDERIRRLAATIRRRRITFGMGADADVSARNIRHGEDRKVRFHLSIQGIGMDVALPVAGEHNVYNALAAAASCSVLGADIEQIRRGLADCRPVAGRMDIIRLRSSACVIDDTYNANPASVREALKTMRALRGACRSAAVLGDMLELGDSAAAWHERVGGFLADSGVDAVFLRGELSREVAAGALERGFDRNRIFFFEEIGEIEDELNMRIARGDWILVKGSRRMKMDEIIRRIVAQWGEGAGEEAPDNGGKGGQA
ncbi:MAG TPA: UDP-N-acetylmuramoyl-tripeptide--D-alanyl-D-alanine ligase [Syntrophales bacterium]|nr:UDP-N-acetylmuramoyl-tripeptide--D-alanyl-D-alanine ligase [Syntrophales bacterium]